VTREVHALDPDQPVADIRTMEEVVNLSMAGARFNTTLLVSFAGVAFLLAAVGIYGVISYDVSQRTNEIGIRMALGAQARDVLGLVMGESMRLVAFGIVIGLVVAMAAGRLVASLLFGLAATDAMTMLVATLVMLVVAATAGYLPARRASRVDPLVALHYE
jgi:putative ABC transport system permease protein